MHLSDIVTLQIEPTSYCNAHCPHCARFDSDGQVHPDLTLDHLDLAVINNLELSAMPNLNLVVLEGDKGDPLMHPGIEHMIEAFGQAASQPAIRLFTNGSIRNPAWWNRLAKKQYPGLTVIFSIDGLKDTNHLYRVGLNYDTIMSNARAFIEAGGHAAWKFIRFKHNEHQFDQVLETSQNMGFAEFIYTTCRLGEFQGLTQWPVRQQGQVTHFLQQPKEYMSGKKVFVTRPSRMIVTQSQPQRLCPNLSAGQIYVNYLGQVIPCCMMHFDTKLNYHGTEQLQEMTGGFDQQDLHRHTLSEILDHQFFKHRLHDSLVKGQWHFNCERSCKSKIIENLKYIKNWSVTNHSS
jgi:sulfatase maturation enzyme AslB (radical SAM superfamily)